jgi:hypothetical protein
MSSSTREDVEEDFAALHAVVSRIVRHEYAALTTPERLGLLERLEKETRRLHASGHQLINQLAEQAPPEELGGRLSHALADRLHITPGEAGRRVAEAADLGPRRAITGEPLPPLLTATAAAEREGTIGSGHVRVIRRFFEHLPRSVDIGTRQQAEAHLAELANEHRPDDLIKLAEQLAAYLNPDGTYTDEDRAHRRGLNLGNQDVDGMSRLSGWLTPEARATLEAVLAKTATPGMCNPDDDTPVVDGPPPEAAGQHDTRSASQRSHDGLNAALRALLASGKLGQHNGLPTTIIVTATLRDLESASGKALTGGGTLLPMSDVIRLARHAHHYLAISTRAKRSGCITPNDWPHPANELCSTPRTVGAHAQAATCPGIGAKSTTSKTGPPRTAPTSTS